ncbi:hypothetical protein [Edaphobacter modestus]|uniref:Uncharacterized protein n=1 Tax=Edaphobacter modestus TaxID=388466 RepID=A0A4Q7YEB7_9BACT|nr:hypothetical protein [Edaphobacter modestus]RZU35480.1 hypothetical protein BDD14_5533 [Edaphobacter modestus]
MHLRNEDFWPLVVAAGLLTLMQNSVSVSAQQVTAKSAATSSNPRSKNRTSRWTEIP